jgi:hypothetical protein
MNNDVFWDDTPCGSLRNYVSEELSASFIRVARTDSSVAHKKRPTMVYRKTLPFVSKLNICKSLLSFYWKWTLPHDGMISAEIGVNGSTVCSLASILGDSNMKRV